MSKGSKRRPQVVSDEELTKRWEETFGPVRQVVTVRSNLRRGNSDKPDRANGYTGRYGRRNKMGNQSEKVE